MKSILRVIEKLSSSFRDTLSRCLPNLPRHKLAAIFSILSCVIAVGATRWWFWNLDNPMSESLSQFFIVCVWLVTSVIEFLAPSDPGWIEIRAKQSKADAEILKSTLAKLINERNNFFQIRDRKGHYNSKSHRQAVEQDSFELLRPEIESLGTVRGYRSKAREILAEIDRNLQMEDKRDVQQLLPLLDSLELIICKHIKLLERSYRGLA